jgi:hypothetical protein
MSPESQDASAPTKNLKRPQAVISILILVAGAYLAWVFVSRHHQTRAYEERVRDQQAEKQHQADQAAIEQLGGDKFEIQMLYATPQIKRGETAQVCFGVSNAKSVTLEPQSNPVWPSHNLCVDVKPTKTTTYTLTAMAADGKSLSQDVTVAVR